MTTPEFDVAIDTALQILLMLEINLKRLLALERFPNVEVQLFKDSHILESDFILFRNVTTGLTSLRQLTINLIEKLKSYHYLWVHNLSDVVTLHNSENCAHVQAVLEATQEVCKTVGDLKKSVDNVENDVVRLEEFFRIEKTCEKCNF